MFFERRGIGLLDLARFEDDLERQLRTLQTTLSQDSWFDAVDIGGAYAVPKRLNLNAGASDQIVRVSTVSSLKTERELEIQMRLDLAPAFAILEVLYIWKFGPILDNLIPRTSVGYRLDLRQGSIRHDQRWLFEYWPDQYHSFRTRPLVATREIFRESETATAVVISADLASFYDSIDASFLLSPGFIEEIEASSRLQTRAEFDKASYVEATTSLLSAYGEHRAACRRITGAPHETGVPIGALTSRLIANLALLELDRHVARNRNVRCYRRYVDDLVVVAKSDGTPVASVFEALRTYLPVQASVLVEEGQEIALDVVALGRGGSRFRLQPKKVRVHELSGPAGVDFIDAVFRDFSRIASESRAFVDEAAFSANAAQEMVRARREEASPLRVLRDADRVRLQRWSFSSHLRAVERISSLIDAGEASEYVRATLAPALRLVRSEEDWVGEIELEFRLLRLAVLARDWVSAHELLEQMNQRWNPGDASWTANVPMRHAGVGIPATRQRIWVSLEYYLRTRVLEAVASVVPLGIAEGELKQAWNFDLREGAKRVGARALLARGRLLRRADLRARDREDDEHLVNEIPDLGWMMSALVGSEFDARKERIVSFVQIQAAQDSVWTMSPARLFVSTRPPSYFDIARRTLYGIERGRLAGTPFNRLKEDPLEHLREVVNAVRGTRYRDAAGRIELGTLELPYVGMESEPKGGQTNANPRVILGNLTVREDWWKRAATRVKGSRVGDPVHSLERLRGVATVLARAYSVAGRPAEGFTTSGPAILVLPELSIPRKWFRSISRHLVRSGLSAVIGVEYLHGSHANEVYNQAFSVLPLPFAAAVTWPWTKRYAAREEARQLAGLPVPVRFHTWSHGPAPQLVVETSWGKFSVLICSELIEVRRGAALLGRVELILCPAWNKDTRTFDYLLRAIGYQVHAIVAVANNAEFSDCRVWGPRKDRWRQDLCRLLQRREDCVIHVTVPLDSLRQHQQGDEDTEWVPLPPDWPKISVGSGSAP